MPEVIERPTGDVSAPWHVSLRIGTESAACGGTVINVHWIVTSAKCIEIYLMIVFIKLYKSKIYSILGLVLY